MVRITGAGAPEALYEAAYEVRIPSEDTGHIQEITCACIHAIMDRVEERLLEAQEGVRHDI